jgi:hypothetical protein
MQNPDSFRTKIVVPEFPWKISYKSRSMFIGSCFTNHIGGRMQELKFKTDVNPFGVVYNPLSVLNSLKILFEKKKFSETDLHFYNDKWFSFSFYTGFSHSDKDVYLEEINKKIKDSSEFLRETDFLFITFGTSRIFEWKKDGQVVSNCHKLPATHFDRRLLSKEEITDEYASFLKLLFKRKPEVKVLFTISPIRHWKDGATGNQLSKAVLLVAVHQLVSMFTNVEYFPSYEIMMDDLRDYRFYAEDMIHLNPVAVNYIWDKFSRSLLDNKTLDIIPEVEKILQAVHHKPFDARSDAYRKFAEKTHKNIQVLKAQQPYLDFSKEESELLNPIDNA